MKHWFKLSLFTILMGVILTGCEGAKGDNTVKIQNDAEEGNGGETAEDILKEGDPAKTEEKTISNDDITLKMIRKAAEDSGFTVTDEHQLLFMKEVKDGFSVRIVADNQDTTYSIIECETEDAAIKNAKDIDDAGYNIAIRKGKFLTCYAVDKKDGTIVGILTSLLEGKAQ